MIANKTDIVKSATANLSSETRVNSPVDHRQQYDDKQAYKSIVAKDYTSDFLVGIGQTAFLAGCQVVTSQYLLSIGVVGLFPVMVSLVPVLGSGLVTLTNFSFDHSRERERERERVRVEIEDKYKAPIQILRTLALSANAGKISFDLHQIDTLAKNSFDLVIKQEREYRNLPEPQANNFFVVFLALFLVFFGAIALRKK
ncbi:hypothetical protein PN497_20090 [Sphaerospermopsis kisseleviana CS-549]|uniref:Uncharacterized protein n=1 Tax=Sphaerospermopsis kisseleviana CS-549 TaxID=3021783 RepID=A0ABT4ZY25_9CYAN|nr:hypothetical protein [Sphaerospermopsis kisseleviana]MDB9443633.1 hypothetical protein [Sphaerospermopsis kisseleviana CS-549]BAZ81076.1 hypothetical protein NIES73_23420 [Sphaerospermopsis kisseleviana NIES-73]